MYNNFSPCIVFHEFVFLLSQTFYFLYRNISTIAVFYALPVIQLVITYQTVRALKKCTLIFVRKYIKNVAFIKIGLHYFCRW